MASNPGYPCDCKALAIKVKPIGMVPSALFGNLVDAAHKWSFGVLLQGGQLIPGQFQMIRGIDLLEQFDASHQGFPGLILTAL